MAQVCGIDFELGNQRTTELKLGPIRPFKGLSQFQDAILGQHAAEVSQRVDQ